MITADLGSKLVLWLLVGGSAGLLLVVSFRDLALRLLPNPAALALALLACLLRLRDGTLLAGLAACAVVFALCYVCWRRGWLGGGDVKLMAASALLVPPREVFDLVVLTALAGGVLAIGYMLAGRLLPSAKRPAPRKPGRRTLLQRLWHVERQRILRGAPLPYGMAIAAAALMLLAGAANPLGH